MGNAGRLRMGAVSAAQAGGSVLGHERRHLPTDLKIRHVAVGIDPVQALDIQGHVSIEKLIYRQLCSHANRMTPARHTKPARTSPVRGAASLDECVSWESWSGD